MSYNNMASFETSQKTKVSQMPGERLPTPARSLREAPTPSSKPTALSLTLVLQEQLFPITGRELLLAFALRIANPVSLSYPL